jgi:hypothetical protein
MSRSFPVTLTVSQKSCAKSAIESLLLKQKNVRFSDAWAAANEAAGFHRGDHHSPCYRLADAYLQKLRKQGVIAKQQDGGWVWNLTEHGRKLLRAERGESL